MEQSQSIEAVEFFAGGIRICSNVFLVSKLRCLSADCDWSMPFEGSSNYIAWKYRMEAVLDDNGMKEFIDAEVPKPTSSDVAILEAWQKKIGPPSPWSFEDTAADFYRAS